MAKFDSGYFKERKVIPYKYYINKKAITMLPISYTVFSNRIKAVLSLCGHMSLFFAILLARKHPRQEVII